MLSTLISSKKFCGKKIKKIRDGIMFVGYATHGIDIYSIRDIDDPRLLGTIDKSYFQDQKNGSGWGDNSASELIFYDFNIKPINFGFQNPNKSNLEKCPNCESLYKIDYTLEERVKWTQMEPLKRDVMWIATNIGVRVVDLTAMYKDEKMPGNLMKKILPIKEAYKVTRFQDQLYVLSHNAEANSWKDKVYSAWWAYEKIAEKNVWEIWLTDYSMDSWEESDPEAATPYAWQKMAKENNPKLGYFF